MYFATEAGNDTFLAVRIRSLASGGNIQCPAFDRIYKNQFLCGVLVVICDCKACYLYHLWVGGVLYRQPTSRRSICEEEEREDCDDEVLSMHRY
ncbi:hypothetical protein ACFX2I_033392 [Malus domestica]